MKIYRKILIVAAAAALPLMSDAQTARELLKQDPSRMANLHHTYEAPEAIADTPAPKGYVPFYVSHYGRHGSRYHVDESKFKKVCAALDTLHILNLLTDEGEQMRTYINMLREEHDGMYGILTQRGAREHQGIAARLYGRCPEIFSQKDRREVIGVSSTSKRCIQSMANFMTTLKGFSPAIEAGYYTGDRFMDYIIHDPNPYVNKQMRDALYDSVYVASVNAERFANAIFRDVDAACDATRSIYKVYPDIELMMDSYIALDITPCLEVNPGREFYSFFTEDEIYGLWLYNNTRCYGRYIENLENLGEREIVGQFILKDMIDKADAALADGSRRAADLRFGHDTAIGPLLGLLQVNGYEQRHIVEAETFWHAFHMLPMATNIQIIFYRSRKSDEILVKILHNERETTLANLKPYSGPYYKWSELRPFFQSLL